ncbi:hypothetical protein [Streptomyces longispororuber]|uniref:hypothetical protein n=1 Tax=Streptomyces longispororuber TaxID=68230 RepID=UPI00210B7F3E|nr:hypothetical protein [Streptomyces longispororuber]MCQ4208066.1 hypothetical protein [Streptomyces longispororuber]
MPTPAKSKKESARTRPASPQKEPERAEAHEHDQNLAVHTLNAKVPIPYFTPGDLASNTRVVTGWLPSPPHSKDLIYYGGLGALAIAGALEWPVALAVAGATWMIRETQEERARRPEPAPEPEAGPPTSMGTGS